VAVSLGELLAQPADPTYYLVFPLLPRGGRLLIGAPPKSKKSMLALNMAYDLAEGLPLLGLRDKDGDGLWRPKRPYTVLYVENEIGQYRLKERMTQIQSARSGDVAPSNLYFEPKGSGIMLDTPEGLGILKARIDALKPDVLVIDPLRKFHTQDEDSSTEMVKVFKTIDALQEENGLTVVMVHHAGKRSEFRDAESPESLRGSSEIFADGDTFVIVSQPAKSDDNLLKLSFTLRSGENPRPLHLKFDPSTFTFRRHQA
jgi:RecA-family ATPase